MRATEARRPGRPAMRGPLLLAALVLLIPLAGLGLRTGQALCSTPLDVRPAVEALAAPAPAAAPRPGRPAQRGPLDAALRSLAEFKARALAAAAQQALVLKRADGLAYPAHALLAGGLERFGCQPQAIALQWLKAASHARSPQEAARADAGLYRQAARLGGPRALLRAITPAVGKYSDPRAYAALARLAAATDAGGDGG